VVGHGAPHTAGRALEIAAEDFAYLDAVVAVAEAGGTQEDARRIARPRRGIEDDEVHAANVAAARRLARGA
jgi:hypothetical protein